MTGFYTGRPEARLFRNRVIPRTDPGWRLENGFTKGKLKPISPASGRIKKITVLWACLNWS
jgi:hypothetical protein